MDEESYRQLLDPKIKILGEQRHKLQVMVDGHIQHIQKVLDTGQAWLEGKKEDESGKTLSIREISQMMEDTVFVMAEKFQYLGEAEVSTRSSQSETVGNIEGPVSSDTVKSVLSRIQVLEETVFSLSSSVKKDIDKQKKDFDSLKDHVEEKLTKKVEDLAQKVTKQEKAGKKFNKVEQRLGELDEFRKQNLGKISAVEKKVERQRINLENFQAVERQRENALESVKEKIEQLEASSMSMASKVEDQVTNTLERQAHTSENQESALQQLTSTVESHSETLQGYSVNREREIERMREVQDRLTVLETEKTEALEEVGKQFADVKQKYEMVCEMVDDRVLPLERLREILNGKIKGREENVEKLREVIMEVADLVPKVSQLEKDFARPAVAVTAQVYDFNLVEGNIVDSWTCVTDNTGGHFDVTTGMFTAPQDGVYGVCLSTWQLGTGEITVSLHKTDPGDNPDPDTDMCLIESATIRDGSGDTDFKLVDLEAGESLYVYVDLVKEIPVLSPFTLSVFLVK